MMRRFLINRFYKASAEPSSYLDTIDTVYLHITKKCNLKCNYCYYDAGNNDIIELTSEELITIISELIFLNPRRIVFTGGEPLLHKDLYKLASNIKRVNKKIILGVSTNGTLITKRIAYDLVCLFDEIRISIDGPREINDFQRGQNSYDHAIRAIKLIIDAGGKPSAFITASVLNISYLKVFMKFLLTAGINKIHVSPLKELGRAKGKNLSCNLVELKRIVEQFNCEQFGICVGPKVLDQIDCGVGNYISINSDGNVYPCHVLNHPDFCIGNLKNEDPLGVLFNSFVNKDLQKKTFNEISNCSFCSMDS